MGFLLYLLFEKNKFLLFVLYVFDIYVFVYVFLDCLQGFMFGKKCFLWCVVGVKMSGGEGSVMCEEDGKWFVQIVFCVMICLNFVILDYSVLFVESNCIGSKRIFLLGVFCKF